jgi:hypothetical protein
MFKRKSTIRFFLPTISFEFGSFSFSAIARRKGQVYVHLKHKPFQKAATTDLERKLIKKIENYLHKYIYGICI